MTRKNLIIIVAVIAVAIVSIFAYKTKTNDDMSVMNMGKNKTVQSHPTYSINLMSGTKYQPDAATSLHFGIQDQTGKVLKSYDTVHEKKLHLIVVRKDRSYFQHVHPVLDQDSGMFMLQPFTFPTDGEYRIFADFTPSNAQKDPMGMKVSATPFKDVSVGALGKYIPVPLGVDKFKSDVAGFTTNLILLSDDSAGAAYITGVPLLLGVNINKDGTPYKNLQTYLGALGHMVVLGPNLEYIHAHTITEAAATQNGLIAFSVTFPTPGQYKLYLQAQADNQVNTTDYTLTLKSINASPSNSQPQSMPEMSH